MYGSCDTSHGLPDSREPSIVPPKRPRKPPLETPALGLNGSTPSSGAILRRLRGAELRFVKLHLSTQPLVH